MTDARDRVLGAVRDALLRATLPHSAAVRPFYVVPDDQTTKADRIAQFTSALIALTGEVHEAGSLDAICDLIAQIARRDNATRYLSWSDEAIECPGLAAGLLSRGMRRVTYDLPVDQAGRLGAARSLATVELGVTGADAALSDGGAIVLASGPGRGRLASLLPPVHIALVKSDRFYGSLPALLAARPDLVARGSNFVVVAGPSRTADIEMMLTHGVHGPKHVHAILIP
ncbi:MAG: lactate utilization protein [Acidobacteriota bacterium]